MEKVWILYVENLQLWTVEVVKHCLSEKECYEYYYSNMVKYSSRVLWDWSGPYNPEDVPVGKVFSQEQIKELEITVCKYP